MGDGIAVVLDVIGLARNHYNDVLALLGHSLEGGTVGFVVLAHLDNDGVEVAVMQLLGEFVGRAGLSQVKALDLGIVGTAACEFTGRALLVTDGGHGDVAALQVVDGQDVIVILDDGDAAGGELALEYLGIRGIDVIHQIGRVHVLAAGEPHGVLVTQYLLAALVDDALADFAIGDSGLDSSNLVTDVLGHEQHVVASQQGVDTGRAVQHLGGAFHVEGVGKNETVKIHLVAQQGSHTTV